MQKGYSIKSLPSGAGKKLNIIFIVFCIVLGEVLVFRNTSQGNALVDFTYQLENAYRISIGQVPYKDFFLVLTPGIYYLDALFLAIFQQSNLGQVILLLSIHFINILFTYLILRKLSQDAFTICVGTLIVALSESVFYPYVIYNTACYDLMLICIYFYLISKNKTGKANLFFLGILVTLPIYFKQNFGLVFLIVFYFYLFFENIRERKIRNFFICIVGSMISALLFFAFLIINGISIHDFIYQTLIFPGTVKQPFSMVIGNVFGAFHTSVIFCALILLALVLFLETSVYTARTKTIISSVAVLTGFVIIPCLYGMNVNNILWFLLFYTLGFVWLTECLFKKNIFSGLSIGIVSFFVFMLGIFTKRVDGPMWLFVFTIVILETIYRKRSVRILFMMALSSMLIWNIYNAGNVKLGWVNEDSVLRQETDLTNRFYKIGIKGNWLPEIKNLTQYINQVIGQDSFVEIPCEDPVYWASGTEPQLNFFQAYPETCPYSYEQFSDIISDHHIQYVIVKINCQFQNYMVNIDNVSEFILQLESRGYKQIDSFDSYRIFWRGK